MPDTGAPWNIPYVENADLVRDWPADSLAVANAVAAGLSAAGGLVEVKSALFTGTQTNSTAAQANFAVTDLEITHALADAGNKLIISAFFGAAGSDNAQIQVGLAVHDGTGLIAIGASPSNRTAVSAGGSVQGSGVANSNLVVTMPSVTFVHAPGDTSSRTYTVRAINISGGTNTLTINRSSADTDANFSPRAVSGFVIQEIKV